MPSMKKLPPRPNCNVWQWRLSIAALTPALFISACSDEGFNGETAALESNLVAATPLVQLPTPSLSLAEPASQLDGEQASRRDEVTRFILNQYNQLGYRILASTQGPSGDISIGLILRRYLALKQSHLPMTRWIRTEMPCPKPLR
jgi:hypothetical protein